MRRSSLPSVLLGVGAFVFCQGATQVGSDCVIVYGILEWSDAALASTCDPPLNLTHADTSTLGGVESKNLDPPPPPPPTQPFVTTIFNPQSSVSPFIKRLDTTEKKAPTTLSFPHFSLTQNMHQRFLGPLLLALLLISVAPNILSRPASTLHSENQVFRSSPIDQGALGHANGIGSEKRRVPTGSNPLHNR
ncbi:hypothetical protein MRB53_017332 [Persea americana]|uniref:Uncharacterized protein n=1 Tax=Persea americana TaxID=3435 RepID=A0ACC2M5E4_PERAE|nr:hypothetical protein MRB53_017332 [Persea americana]